VFPILVILPGMIAAGLAYEAKDGYRLPPVRVETAKLEAAADLFKQPMAQDQLVMQVSAITGKKMLPDKIAAIASEYAASPIPAETLQHRVQNAVAENDYDGVILSLVKKYCPTGLLGLALTALLASFMSGMAGNVTAFNTVWTYDLYQAYIAPNKSDDHYMWMGRSVTVVGVLLSIGAAYFASSYNNAMDVIQLVFGFVNAPLFATFLLGMFWSRSTSHGAFFGLLIGTATSAVFHSLTIAAGNAPGIKGGYLAVLHSFPSEMAQNFWLATFAFSVCFVLTGAISLATKRTKSDEELKGLVYSLTPRLKDEEKTWYLKPAVGGSLLMAACVIINILFW